MGQRNRSNLCRFELFATVLVHHVYLAHRPPTSKQMVREGKTVPLEMGWATVGGHKFVRVVWT
jgi:hypothetical protein